MLRAYSKEWDLGKKGKWEWDETGTRPVITNAVDITAEDRELAAQAAQERNDSKPNYSDEEIQDLVFQEANKVAERLVEDSAVLESGIHILVILAKRDSNGEIGKLWA